MRSRSFHAASAAARGTRTRDRCTPARGEVGVLLVMRPVDLARECRSPIGVWYSIGGRVARSARPYVRVPQRRSADRRSTRPLRERDDSPTDRSRCRLPVPGRGAGPGGRHTPVWFMRQAGRSLPEYRAVRGEGSILDAIKQPELAAEITLQPVRRYGVDAAVLYSDIVVPAHAVGFGIDVAPGTGPVAAATVPHGADLDRLRPLEPRRRRLRRRDGRLLADGAAGRRAAARVRRRTVHRRQLPDRGTAEPRRTAHQGVDAHRRGALARLMERLADSADHVHRRPAAATAPAPSSCSTRGPERSRPADYERFVLPHSRRVFAELAARHPDAPGIHFGIGCDHLLEAMHAAGPTVIGLDWRTPIAEARRRLGADSRPGQPRSGARARRRRRGARRRRAGARRQRRPPGSHLQPRPRRATRDRPRRAQRDRRARARRRLIADDG